MQILTANSLNENKGRSFPIRWQMSTLLDYASGFVKQSIAHSVIADDDTLGMIARHNPFNQAGAGENDIGSLRLKAGDLPALGNRSSLKALALAYYGIDCQRAAMNFAVRIARQTFFHSRQSRKRPGNTN
jgi:hypothetical protein